MEAEAAVSTLSRKIGVLAIADTQYIKDHYTPGHTPATPAAVKPAHLFMVGTGLRGHAGELKLNAKIGDIVSISGTSTDHNSSDAVIVYKVQPVAQGNVLGPFKQHIVTRRGAVEPDPDSPSRDGLPAVETTANFLSFESKVRAHGSGGIRVEFALYTLAQNGQDQVLVGYYSCDLHVAATYHR